MTWKTRLWQYVCEAYCTRYLVRWGLGWMATEESMTYHLQWPEQPNPLPRVARWLMDREYLEGNPTELPWFWTWRAR